MDKLATVQVTKPAAGHNIKAMLQKETLGQLGDSVLVLAVIGSAAVLLVTRGCRRAALRGPTPAVPTGVVLRRSVTRVAAITVVPGVMTVTAFWGPATQPTFWSASTGRCPGGSVSSADAQGASAVATGPGAGGLQDAVGVLPAVQTHKKVEGAQT